MLTLRETPIYSKMIDSLLPKDMQGELHSYIANNVTKGDVIPHSGGCRKIRWTLQGKGKSAGIRVIYYNQLENGVINLLLAYAKSKQENIPSHILKQIVKELDND
ncbi:hypothetical protein QJU43_09740 [Pasteurella atlantica]|nr:hypothetical protein [Pasteurella atlantica]MDP8032674.1 hypothetical protein [Pasteurella atlantica]MDP8038436.1 hypothetical protein [Pasteurella atlantica]MDP8050039.1 hypothetical protein [Pasteurella atlantica]MDP8056722.1 hypothetical protein [Pasteurella atlantica]MDP8064641.1 hypothetical protein [Pasteurella atlantica]